MKYVGIVIKQTWNIDDDKKRKYHVEKSRLYDTLKEANKWIEDKGNETNEVYDVISIVYRKKIIISDSTVIAIDEKKSDSNFNDILTWLAAYTLQD